MITLDLPVFPSGDVSQVDTSNIKKGSIFADEVRGAMIWNGSGWVGADGITFVPLNRINTDLKYDASVSQWYLEIDASYIISCEINNKSYTGQLDKTLTPYRYFSSFDNGATPQTIKLLAVL